MPLRRATSVATATTTTRSPAAAAASAVRAASSVSQRPHSDYVSFPGALKSAFTSTLKYEVPESYQALPTYRVVDQHGEVVDQSFTPDITDEQVVKLYKDMLYISIMDLIMFDAQRQGRLSFYMVSAGEEAVSVGSSSVLDPEDPVYCQYREQGFFKERGFTTKEFMSQLFANKNDTGKGRNMPIHYGSGRLNIVRFLAYPPLRYLDPDQSSTQSRHRLPRNCPKPRAPATRSRCSGCKTPTPSPRWPSASSERARPARATSTRP